MDDDLGVLDLIDLVVEVRSNSLDDLDFARRIVLAAIELAERCPKQEPLTVLRAAFSLT